ncbi:MAG: winged helix-turn-helix transcriptional regulator [Rhizobiales bacterium]|nr:winged helix-turn-helix transcriptional regulator [Hyphomicrobiales bacterium]
MKYGPDIAGVAALIGDPARANILTALMGGSALTATELASEAGVTKQTASAHLAKLTEASFIAAEKQGRHRYFRLADHQIAEVLENLMGLAAKRKPTRIRTGPKEPALRKARVCYDHLAGDLGVRLFESLDREGWLNGKGGPPHLTEKGEIELADFGIDLDSMRKKRRPLCRSCLDWSVRRSHLAGSVGAELLNRFYALKWAKRVEGTRIVQFTGKGEEALRQQFKLQ